MCLPLSYTFTLPGGSYLAGQGKKRSGRCEIWVQDGRRSMGRIFPGLAGDNWRDGVCFCLEIWYNNHKQRFVLEQRP